MKCVFSIGNCIFHLEAGSAESFVRFITKVGAIHESDVAGAVSCKMVIRFRPAVLCWIGRCPESRAADEEALIADESIAAFRANVVFRGEGQTHHLTGFVFRADGPSDVGLVARAIALTLILLSWAKIEPGVQPEYRSGFLSVSTRLSPVKGCPR